MTDRETTLSAIRDRLGKAGVVEDATGLETYNTEWRGHYHGSATFVARPANAEECAFVVKTCFDAGIPVVPLGGNTGLVGGAVAESEVVISTERMNKVRSVDTINGTMTVEAGCILADIQRLADDNDRLFPLSLAAEGSCRIGGNLATNAGGTAVLRYGNARDLVLGLEVVLPTGELWDGLRALRKDNTGYDLKHLFMGSEGTLGIITAAVLKLFPKPRQVETTLIALDNVEAVTKLFSRANAAVGDALTAFEYMNRDCIEVTCKHTDGVRDPFEAPYPAYVLMELTSARNGTDLREALEAMLEEAFEAEEVLDAVFAESGQQREELWQMRETIPEAQGHEGGSIKNDISVPISRMPEFLARADAMVEEKIPGIRPMTFGHIGDGNLHYNLTQPAEMDRKEFMGKWHDVTDPLNEMIFEMTGSFSAEHGVGKLKRDELVKYTSPVEIELMKKVKAALDPKGLMNPGKVL